MKKYIIYILLLINFTACSNSHLSITSCEGKFNDNNEKEIMKLYYDLKMTQESFEKRFFLCLIEERLHPKITSNICYKDMIDKDLNYISSNKEYNETELFIAMLFSSDSKYNDEIARIYNKNEATLSMVYPNFDRCDLINDYLTSNVE